METTIIVPTYNEAENIPILIERMFTTFHESNLNGKVIVVDDNSPDETWRVAQELKSKYSGLDVIRRLNERGLSSAVVEGFRASGSEILGVMDADLSHPTEKIPELVRPIVSGEADFVIGSRYVREGGIGEWPFKRKLSSKLATLAVYGLTKVNDPMSGFFFLKREVLDGVKLDTKGFKIGLEILVKGNYNKVVEVPIVFRDRLYGQTKLSTGVIVDYLHQLARLYLSKLS